MRRGSRVLNSLRPVNPFASRKMNSSGIKKTKSFRYSSWYYKEFGHSKFNRFDDYIKRSRKRTDGEAVSGMIMNGLGFVNKPLTLAPQFLKPKL